MSREPSSTKSEGTPARGDVRMRGFAERTTVEAALAWLDAATPTFAALETEEALLSDVAGRVLARDVISPVDVPSFARAMMDGLALRAEDTQGATPYNQLPLSILGACLPGAKSDATVGPGSAVEIMTGAPMPAGADAVLPFEQTQFDGRRAMALGEASPGKHVGQIGEDVRTGDVVLAAGRRLLPQDVGLLSSLGLASAPVIQRPRVRIVITGNELLAAGVPPAGVQITDANGPMLAALVQRDGGEAIRGPIVPDEREAILAALHEPADVTVVSGGSSVGQEDFAPMLLAEHGELAIHGIAMRPSSPTGMGRIDGRLVFLLPGNPVSCLCAYDFFAGRAIRALGGRPRDWPYRRICATLTRKLASTVGRVDYARVTLENGRAAPVAIGGASVLSSVTRAHGFVIVPADSEGFPEGREVEVLLYQ